MQDLRVTVIQSKLDWQDPEENRSAFSKKILEVKGKTDLIVLPEMFTSGFSMQVAELAETMNGLTVAWMKSQAADIGAAINGSIIIQDQGEFFNRSLFIHPNGEVEYYDKRHLFRMANEDEHFSSGKTRKIVEYKGWRICLQVCYDLRFPVFSRNQNDHDILIYVANWPQARTNVWSILLQARAMENQSFVIGVNRVGKDGMDIEYSGASAILNARGEELLNIPLCEEGNFSTTLSFIELQAFRKKFPIHKDADDFQLKY